MIYLKLVVLKSEPVITSSPVSVVARGGKPSERVATKSLVPVSLAVTDQGESDANNAEDDKSDADNAQAEVGTSDADEEVLPSDLPATQPNETDSRCCRGRIPPIRYGDQA